MIWEIFFAVYWVASGLGACFLVWKESATDLGPQKFALLLALHMMYGCVILPIIFVGWVFR